MRGGDHRTGMKQEVDRGELSGDMSREVLGSKDGEGREGGRESGCGLVVGGGGTG